MVSLDIMDSRKHRYCCVCHVSVLLSGRHATCIECLGVEHATNALISTDFCRFCAKLDLKGLQARLAIAKAKAASFQAATANRDLPQDARSAPGIILWPITLLS